MTMLKDAHFQMSANQTTSKSKKEDFKKAIDDKIIILGEIIDLLARLRELVD